MKHYTLHNCDPCIKFLLLPFFFKSQTDFAADSSYFYVLSGPCDIFREANCPLN